MYLTDSESFHSVFLAGFSSSSISDIVFTFFCVTFFSEKIYRIFLFCNENHASVAYFVHFSPQSVTGAAKTWYI